MMEIGQVEIGQIILEILKPHGFQIIEDGFQITGGGFEDWSFSNISRDTRRHHKIVNIVGAQIKLYQRNIPAQSSTWDVWNTITVDLCDPNSLQIIEDWAKTP